MMIRASVLEKANTLKGFIGSKSYKHPLTLACLSSIQSKDALIYKQHGHTSHLRSSYWAKSFNKLNLYFYLNNFEEHNDFSYRTH